MESKIGELDVDNIYCMDCLLGLKKIYDSTIDLIVTSPPYDNLRTFGSNLGNGIDLLEIGKECFRVMKDGAIMALIIQDQTKDFGKSCTTARTTVDYVDKIGFKLFETIIWRRHGRPGAWWNNRFRVDHEYILLFLKGKRPKYFNKEPLKVEATYGGGLHKKNLERRNDGSLVRAKGSYIVIPEKKCRGTVWDIPSSTHEKNRLKLKHPATKPDKLAEDLIVCFSDKGDIVMDIFAGSGTVLRMAKKNMRRYIGFEINEEYWRLANYLIRKEEVNAYTP